MTIKAPVEAVKAAFVGTVANIGYSLKSDTTLQVVVERDPQNALANMLLGSNYDSRVIARLSATFIQNGGETRLFADLNLVTNSGSAFERLTPMTTSQDSIGLQNVLNDIKVGLEAGRSATQVASDTTAAIQSRKLAAGR